MVNCKKMLLGLGLLVAGSCQASVYLDAKNYNGAYVPPAGSGEIIFTASSPAIAQTIQNSGAVPPPPPPTPPTPPGPSGKWALNTAKGKNGAAPGFSSQLIGPDDSSSNVIAGMVVNSDGSFVTVGTNEVTSYTYLQVARFLNSGELDTSFNSDGYNNVMRADAAAGVISDGSGGYYVAADSFVINIKADGTQNTNFGNNSSGNHSYTPTEQSGIVGIARQSTGSVVCLARASDGTLKTYLMASGGATTAAVGYANAEVYPCCCAIDGSDKALITGLQDSNAYVYRLTADITLDSTFSGTGSLTLPSNFSPKAIAVLSDNSMIIVGATGGSSSTMQAVKVTSAGILDWSVIIPSLTAGSFDTANSVVVISEGFALGGASINSDYYGYFATVLLNPDGSHNTKFSISGETTLVTGTAVVQPVAAFSNAYAIGYQPATGSTGLVVTGVSNTRYGAVFYTNNA